MEFISIINKYHEQLAAYLFTPPHTARCLVVICHGFRGAKENGGKIFAWAEKLQRLGVASLAFDFSGSGSSEGDFARISLSRQASDLKAVLDYAHDRLSMPMILLGRSFGGSTVLVGGSGDPRVAGYILWSTPIKMEQTFAGIMPEAYQLMRDGAATMISDEGGSYMLKSDLVKDFARHDMDKYLQAIGSRPVLIVQASDDEVVHPDNALYMQTRLADCSLHMVESAGHRFMNKTEEREKITIEWLEKKFCSRE